MGAAVSVIDTNDNVSAHLESLRARGVTAIGRYYSSRAWKRLTRAEAAAITAQGMKIFTVFEDDGDPNLTRDNGLNHAQIAIAQARDVGQPTGSAIYFALEHLPGGYKRRHVEGIMDYVAGLRDGLAGRYELGIYSSGVVLDALLNAGACEYTWLSASMSFEGSREFYASNRWSIAQVTADGRPQIDQNWDGVSVDVNQAKADFGQFKVEVTTNTMAALTSIGIATIGGGVDNEDPAAPGEGELSDTADFETARFFANSGNQWGAVSDTPDVGSGVAGVSAAGAGAAAAGLSGFDLARAKQFLDDCMNSHPRVTYGLGAKVPFLGAVPGRDFTKVDCSGFVREAIRLSTNPRVPFPDGSVVQHDWVKAHQFERSTVDDGADDDGVVRIAFLSPHDSPQGIGHVMLLSGGKTLESHGGTGPDSRIWADLGFRKKMSVYVLSRGSAAVGLASLSIVAAGVVSDAPTFTVRNGHRYRATVVLRGFEALVGNDTVVAKFSEIGFTDVNATGSGSKRQVEGTWSRDDTTAQIDPRLKDIVELPANAAAPLAAPSIVGRAVPVEEGGGLPPSVFSARALPSHHDNLLVVSARADRNLMPAVAGPQLAAANIAAFEPVTQGLSALNFFDRAGLVRAVTPLRGPIVEAPPGVSFSAGARIMAASVYETTAAAAAAPVASQGTSFIELEPGQNVEQLRRELAGDPNVISVSTVPARYLAARAPGRKSSNEGEDPGSDVGIEAMPPGGLLAWNLRKILWPQARAQPGFVEAESIRVAVLDTGVDDQHSDLEIDEYHWKNSDISEPVSDKDIVGHGTHVSGIISAVLKGPNSVSGVCRCKLTVWKIFSDKPRFAAGAYHYFVHPILYRRALAALVDNPVDVVNLSIGGPGAPDPTERALFNQLLAAGVTVCAAMGNDRQFGSPISYPAAIPGVIAVGATGLDDRVTVFSNSGNHIALSAPGKAIWSTLPHYAGQTGFSAVLGPDGKPQQSKAQKREIHYDAWDGTSMATPHVSGSAALLIAKHGTGKLSPAQVRAALMEKADKVSGMNGADFTPDYGAGRLNLDKVLK
jgi:subtilisin family serine protease